MKKVTSMLLALVCALSLVACGKSAPAELYTGEADFLEAGYEGDCINTNRQVLVLNSDGTYTLEQGFFVNQISGTIVFFTKNVYTGKYTAGAANAEGQKTISLEAPTAGHVSTNGSITTSAEDSEILSEFNSSSITIDTTTGSIIMQ